MPFSPFLLILLLIACGAIEPSVDISASGLLAKFEERTSPETRNPHVNAVALQFGICQTLAGTAKCVIWASWDAT